MKRIVKILCISIIVTVLFTINSFAVVQVQIIPNDKRITSVSVSTSFKTCREMDSIQSTLGTTSLDPHLATNKDWGAVSYLANSVYGVNTNYDTANSPSGKVGKEVVITYDGTQKTFLSTTGNASGIMNWGGSYGKTLYCHTSGLLASVVSITDDEQMQIDTGNAYPYIKLLLENRNTRYVESLGSNIGMAMSETQWGSMYYISTGSKKLPVTSRRGLFGSSLGGTGWNATHDYYGSLGGPRTDTTFRPVIWNIE